MAPVCRACAQNCHRLLGHFVTEGVPRSFEVNRRKKKRVAFKVCACGELSGTTGLCAMGSSAGCDDVGASSAPATANTAVEMLALSVLPESLCKAVECALILPLYPHAKESPWWFSDSQWRQDIRARVDRGPLALSDIAAIIADHAQELLDHARLDTAAIEYKSHMVAMVRDYTNAKLASMIRFGLRSSIWLRVSECGTLLRPVHRLAPLTMSMDPRAQSRLLCDADDANWETCADRLSATLKRSFPKPISDKTYSPFEYVQSTDALWALSRRMAEEDIREVAFDFEGFHLHAIWMVQITLRYRASSVGLDSSECEYVYADYLVDPIPLKAHIRDALLPVMENPSVVKVMHGSSEDIAWLQRDYGIFVANLWDTSDAALRLGDKRSLYHLLQKHCGVEASKDLRMTEWNQRPLASVVLKYAREDTHYLLYIYDKMRALLQLGSPTRAAAQRRLDKWFISGASRSLKVATSREDAMGRMVNPQ